MSQQPATCDRCGRPMLTHKARGHICGICRSGPTYEPTPEQIAEECARIFADTPPEEFSRRALLGHNDRRTINGIATEGRGWALVQADGGEDWSDAKREHRRKKR